MINRLLLEDIGIGTGQEIVFESETLDIPACTPDAGPIRHTVGRLGRLFVELSLVVRKGCAEGCDELSAPLVFLRFELFGDTSRKPTSTGDTVGDELLLA